MRDVPGLVEQGFPVFARAATPRVGTNRRLGQTQVPVSCGGVVVRPGDLVMGDDNGVVVIPRDREEGLAAALEALWAKEERLIQGIQRWYLFGRRALGLRPCLRMAIPIRERSL